MTKKPTKCECPEKSKVSPNKEYMYSAEEKSGMNHEPNKCKGTNKIKTYLRDGKKLKLCSCCNVFGDKKIENLDSID